MSTDTSTGRKRTKCRRVKNDLRECWMLQEMRDCPTSTLSGVGIVAVTTVHPNGPNQFHGYCFKQKRKDRGVMMNYCPWCGEKIYPVRNRDETKG